MATAEAATKPLTIALLAGELSGDNLGAPLMRALRRQHPAVRFVGIGGPAMKAAGLECWTDLEQLSVNGFVDPLKRLPSLLHILFSTRDQVLAAQADCFIGVDFNFFNGLLEGMLKRRGVRTAHYVSPSVWAWRKGRIKSIKKNIDLMLTLYPFEKAIYTANAIQAVFVGHPRADEISPLPDPDARRTARAELGIDEQSAVVALLPGSRASEVGYSGPDFLQAAQLIQQQLNTVTFVMPAANQRRESQLRELLGRHGQGLDVRLLQGQAETAMLAADVVLVNAGTATLEAMLLRRPMVMSYRLGWFTHALVSRLVSTPFFALPNILAGRQLVRELIQDEATPAALCAEVLRLFEPANRTALLAEYAVIHQQLRKNAGEQAAAAILELCQQTVAA
jgi:lipid-A-disaccharide synthase